jgi:beta-lactamase regulating signal transducer with metallopeptidase domain
MERLLTILGSEFCSDLAAALLHTLWQGALAAAVLYLFLKSGRATNANARYAACVITLGAVVLCGFISWAVLDYEPARVSESGKASPVIETAKQGSLDAGPVQERTVVREWGQRACTIAERAYSLNWQGYAVALWLVGVAVMLYRTASMVAGLQRLRRVCVGLEDERVLGIIEDLRKEMGISRRIRAVVARHIQAPGVIGFVWPTLLLPVSMLSGVPAEDLKAILSHELAHIRRYDYLVNWCQMIVEAVLFFNPAVWWISRQIRIEREACCDMVVVAATGQRVRYAQMLAEWAQRLGYAGAPAAGAAAIG